MGTGGENSFHDLGDCRSAMGGPMDQPLGRPFGIVAVGGGHVRGHGAVAPLVRRPLVAGDPFALVEEFHHLGTQADVELLLDQHIGHRVVMPFDVDMVVDVICAVAHITSYVVYSFMLYNL